MAEDITEPVQESEQERSQWGSKLGFILAASGSAIGLGNIVFFGANAYKYGAGAFYFPYLIALFLIGIPIMILELGLGSYTRRAFPQSLHIIAGKAGEFIGWWGLLSATFITMYYVTILAWVLGMLIGAFGPLWEPASALPAFKDIPELPNPLGYFFDMISSWETVAFVVVLWFINIVLVWKGVNTIEKATKIFVPLMWGFMIFLIIRGLTLEHGMEGIHLLFTPNFEVMKSPEVWKGAFSQMFFSLSLGFGIMTAYASYLPKDSDQVTNPLIISFMNCSFEFLAGLAIFSMLFVFVIAPKASTLSMMFFVLPEGIAQMGSSTAVMGFGIMFFTLLLVAGLSSSISLVEAFISAVLDKFHYSRSNLLAIFGVLGCMGSVCFALPQIVDGGLNSNGTLGLTLLDLIDHWAFSYGLIIVGFIECILVGWIFGAEKLRENINKYTAFKLPAFFDVLIKFIIPAILLMTLLSSAYSEFQGIYGHNFTIDGMSWLPQGAFLFWLASTIAVAAWLTTAKDYSEELTQEEGEVA